jgi:hypothetical protein
MQKNEDLADEEDNVVNAAKSGESGSKSEGRNPKEGERLFWRDSWLKITVLLN